MSCYQNAKRIKVKLRRKISCESQACQFGCEQFENVDEVCMDLSNQVVTTNNSVILQPRPLEILCGTVPTSKINGIVSLNYIVPVTAVTFSAYKVHIEISIAIGNAFLYHPENAATITTMPVHGQLQASALPQQPYNLSLCPSQAFHQEKTSKASLCTIFRYLTITLYRKTNQLTYSLARSNC